MQDYIHSERLYIHSTNGKSLNLSLLSFSERSDGRESRAPSKDNMRRGRRVTDNKL